MRINIYAEELTDRVEIIEKKTADGSFTGVRFYLYLPVSLKWSGDGCSTDQPREQVRGPFIHHEGDDDSAAVTFWGKKDLMKALQKAIKMLADHYEICPICGDDTYQCKHGQSDYRKEEDPNILPNIVKVVKGELPEQYQFAARDSTPKDRRHCGRCDSTNTQPSTMRPGYVTCKDCGAVTQ